MEFTSGLSTCFGSSTTSTIRSTRLVAMIRGLVGRYDRRRQVAAYISKSSVPPTSSALQEAEKIEVLQDLAADIGRRSGCGL